MLFLPVPKMTTCAFGTCFRELRDGSHHDVAALLLFEATDVAEDRRIGIERQANFSLERLLGGSLTFDGRWSCRTGRR